MLVYRATISGLLIACMAASFSQESPAKDRSGEGVLREVLRDMGSLKDVEIWVSRFERDADHITTREAAIQIWQSRPSVFRALYNSVWGDSGLMISHPDGFLTDLLYQGEPAGLGAPIKTYAEGLNRFDLGSSFGVYPYFLDGEASVAALAPESGTVTLMKGGQSDQRAEIESTGSRFGRLRIAVRKVDGVWRVTNLEAAQGASSSSVSPAGSLDEVSYHAVKLKDEWFRPAPEKGVQVIDLRKKPGLEPPPWAKREADREHNDGD